MIMRDKENSYEIQKVEMKAIVWYDSYFQVGAIITYAP